MSVTAFGLGLARVAVIALPALLGADLLRRCLLGLDGPLGLLADLVLAVSMVVIGAECLGLVGLMHPAELAAVSVAFAVGAWLVWSRAPAGAWARRQQAARFGAGVGRPGPRSGTPDPAAGGAIVRWSVLVSLTLVIAQWCEATANVLGGGMLSFDTLWYHMPFAARFAQSGSVTAIPFTQADPYVAYYPANSEMLHGIGIAAMRGDFLSPWLNLFWLAVFLLSCACVGLRWGLGRYTLIAGCLCAGLPVLSTTQPGQAFSDIAGLAMLVAGAALVVAAGDRPAVLATAGLALGLALGTKVTFLVPALVLLLGAALLGPAATRLRRLLVMAVPLLLAGGWWYLRDAVATGNPFGVRLQAGPIVLGGAHSILADEQQGTVISNLDHLSLWGSRFVPGLSHALGILWPLLLTFAVAGVAGGLAELRPSRGLAELRRSRGLPSPPEPLAGLLALTALGAALTYLFLPTSASGIARGTTLFEVNLRYLTPALTLALIVVPVVVARRRPGWLSAVAAAMTVILVAAQFEHSVWPAQPARHAAFVLATAVGITLLIAIARSWRAWLVRARPLAIAGALTALLLLTAGGAFALQRHYFQRRYRVGRGADATLFAWAQGVANSRLAVYGGLTEYPLFGARDTNHVDYLGRHTPGGGFVPISTCRSWRALLTSGHYDYVVLTPGPTATVPVGWTATDPAARLVLAPGPGRYVFRVSGPLHASRCPG